jgi:hypothetical protein
MRSFPLTAEPSGQAFSTDTVTMQWERLLAAFMAVAGGGGEQGRVSTAPAARW